MDHAATVAACVSAHLTGSTVDFTADDDATRAELAAELRRAFDAACARSDWSYAGACAGLLDQLGELGVGRDHRGSAEAPTGSAT